MKQLKWVDFWWVKGAALRHGNQPKEKTSQLLKSINGMECLFISLLFICDWRIEWTNEKSKWSQRSETNQQRSECSGMASELVGSAINLASMKRNETSATPSSQCCAASQRQHQSNKPAWSLFDGLLRREWPSWNEFGVG